MLKERTANPSDRKAIRDAALNLLARREHSVLELHHKLTHRGFVPAAVNAVLDELTAGGWIDERRYAEVYATSRADKGYGPFRIRQELRERGVGDDAIAAVLSGLDDFWPGSLARVSRRRFGEAGPATAADRARRQRFLRQRGFPFEQIEALFRQQGS